MSGWRWAIVVSFILAVATGIWKGGFWPGVAMWASLLLWIAIAYGICEALRASE
ncbi:MAG: sensor histidine kinase, partial [Deltaproteobacteria bacterium]|nr:sensor histidine kinase [Deltaproteobacteria bacterium]